MGAVIRGDWTTTGVRVAERGLVKVRSFVGGVLDTIQIRLRIWEATRDPEGQLWADEMRQAVKDGTIWELVEGQSDRRAVLRERGAAVPAEWVDGLGRTGVAKLAQEPPVVPSRAPDSGVAR